MKKIISKTEPFSKTQNIYVYEDGNKIDSITTTIKDFSNDVIALLKKYEDIKELNLFGSKLFNLGISKKIKEELLKYNKNELIINLGERKNN